MGALFALDVTKTGNITKSGEIWRAKEQFIGKSGPLPAPISKAINDNDVVAAAVLSGNRNFEGRVNADVRANYLASPPLVVAYAIAGTTDIDLATEPLGVDQSGQPVLLRDIWPTTKEVQDAVKKSVRREMFAKEYGEVFKGDAHWQKMGTSAGMTYKWQPGSTYVKLAPYFEELPKEAGTFDIGVETVIAETCEVLSDTVIRTDPVTGATSDLRKSESRGDIHSRQDSTGRAPSPQTNPLLESRR